MAMSFANSGLPSMPDFAGSQDFANRLSATGRTIDGLYGELAQNAIGARYRDKIAEIEGKMMASGGRASSAPGWGDILSGLGGIASGVVGALNKTKPTFTQKLADQTSYAKTAGLI